MSSATGIDQDAFILQYVFADSRKIHTYPIDLAIAIIGIGAGPASSCRCLMFESVADSPSIAPVRLSLGLLGAHKPLPWPHKQLHLLGECCLPPSTTPSFLHNTNGIT